jgi:hypothetical protein
MFAAEMAVHWRNDEIHVTAPKLHFLSGSALDRLKNGNTVPFDFQLSLISDRAGSQFRSAERFLVSYDLWEEKYSVSRQRGTVSARENLTVSHLSANAAESWCIDHIALRTPTLSAGETFRVRLEVRGSEPRQEPGLVSETGVSLTRLIEVFSHPARPEQQRWAVESGPMKLDDLRRTSSGS